MEDNNNMATWDKLKSPPGSALKQITGGRLQGFTDVNPQWRYQAMTEQFGPCGIGWKFTVEKLWLEPAPEGQMFAFAEVNVWVSLVQGEWSEPIPGIGGSMLVEKERQGLHANDEAYKMAITDGLGTAMKMLGVAADIYAGKWDGSKYRDTKVEPENKAPVEKSEHWCSIHNIQFFRKGAMKHYAHPIEGGWCNEPPESLAQERKRQEAPSPEKRGPEASMGKVSGGNPERIPVKDLGDLLTRCQAMGVDRKGVLEIAQVQTVKELAQMDLDNVEKLVENALTEVA